MCISVSKSAVFILLLALLAVVPAGAMLDPSAVYCKASGYAYETVMTSAGSEYGVCRTNRYFSFLSHTPASHPALCPHRRSRILSGACIVGHGECGSAEKPVRGIASRSRYSDDISSGNKGVYEYFEIAGLAYCT